MDISQYGHIVTNLENDHDCSAYYANKLTLNKQNKHKPLSLPLFLYGPLNNLPGTQPHQTLQGRSTHKVRMKSAARVLLYCGNTRTKRPLETRNRTHHTLPADLFHLFQHVPHVPLTVE